MVSRKKWLSARLSTVPEIPNPSEYLEQYTTPPEIAADFVWEAFMRGDIEGRHTVDLGCGTGRLTAASLILGASRATCIDIDEEAVRVAKEWLTENVGGITEFLVSDVVEALPFRFIGGCTVIMNPPFGVWRRGADAAFLKAAASICGTIYSMHKYVPESMAYLSRLMSDRGFGCEIMKVVDFPIRWFLERHRSRVRYVKVAYVRCLSR